MQVTDDALIGARLTSTVPFALFTGSAALVVPHGLGRHATPVLHQLAPVAAWDNEYAAVKFPPRYTDREDATLWRIVASADDTLLTYDPRPPPGAPSRLRAGELAVFSATAADEAFVVRSQDSKHSFHVSQLMPNGFSICTPPRDDAGVEIVPYDCRGKSALVSLPSRAELATKIAFLTDGDYPDTTLVVVRRSDERGDLHDVDLDCAGPLTDWRPIGTEGVYEYSYVTLVKGNFEPQRVGAGTCDNGAHIMKSEGPFSVSVWAWTHGSAYPPELPGPNTFSGMTYAYTALGRTMRPDAGVAR